VIIVGIIIVVGVLVALCMYACCVAGSQADDAMEKHYAARMNDAPPVDPYADANRCVCCGAIIPEGRQVCLTCEGGFGGANKCGTDTK